jgi:hypothetical protein
VPEEFMAHLATAAKFRSAPEHGVLRVLAGANEVMKALIARSL